jgi:hypothetical protein
VALAPYAPPEDPAGLAPPPFGAPGVSPERKAAAAAMIEAAKLLLTAIEADPSIEPIVSRIAAVVTKAAGQLQRPPTSPLGADGEPAPVLDRTPAGPPEPGTLAPPFLSRSRRA